MLISDLVEQAALATPNALALVDGERAFTFAQLWDLVRRAASAVAARTKPGDRIALVSENSAEMLAVAYGAPMVGRSVVFGNTRLSPTELTTLLADARPTLVLASTARRIRLADHCDTTDLGRLFADNAPGSADPTTEPTADPADPCWLIHTSGTTGLPKAAICTHASLLAAANNTALARPDTPPGPYLFPFPLFHVAAYNVLVAHLGARAVVLVPKFDSADVLAQIERHCVESMSLAPTMLTMLLDDPAIGGHDLSSLQVISYGAAPMPPALIARGTAALGCGFAQGYGMTELSGNAVFLSPADHVEGLTSNPTLLAAAGKPGPMTELRISAADGSQQPDGQPGEIWVRGPQVAAGYLDRDAETAATFHDGWLRTGDVGLIDDGYLYVVDRQKDIVITGGENVASREVEDVLAGHPAVGQVAVIGVPHPQWGEAIVAVVLPAPGHGPVDPEDIRTWSASHLSGFKRPKVIVTVDEFPLNASGKVQKTVLRQQFSRMFSGPG